ncbi:hypothetical protein [Desulfomicrobium norvegicum]|uniref:hypothetical protein n=1 Tax=Desulfomicrobium norvegicum (strain DSM 1741 / NCIMB 8310) TaxID=52561 RepID=UPI00129472A2|nr:hypothetical protein [Desulfomicrobium norvegicum]
MLKVRTESALLCLPPDDAKFKNSADMAQATSKKPKRDLPLFPFGCRGVLFLALKSIWI